MFNEINQKAFAFVNGYAGQNPLLDALVLELANNHLFKGLVVATVLVGLWVSQGGRSEERRTGVISAILISVVSILAGRLLAKTLPFSPRPIYAPDIKVTIPAAPTGTIDILEGWSSMPSDNAVMYFALATSVFLLSRRVGLFLFVHAAFIVSSRVFAGLHWPADVVVGACVGIFLALALHKPMTRMITRASVAGLISCYPMIGYPTLFFTLFQLATMYESLRHVLSLSLSIIRMSLVGG